MKKINEIFYSLQGEGRNAGRAAIFVRFSGCNLRCGFCDTKHKTGVMMSDEQIIAECNQYPCTFIVLTGGEPSLFINEEFIQKLHEAGYTVAIETNGTHPLPFGLNFVTVSPKVEFCEGAAIVLKECDELKVVFTGDNDMSVYDEIAQGATYKYLQPCDTGEKARNEAIIAATVDYIKAHPDWRLSLQTQKIIGVR